MIVIGLEIKNRLSLSVPKSITDVNKHESILG